MMMHDDKTAASHDVYNNDNSDDTDDVVSMVLMILMLLLPLLIVLVLLLSGSSVHTNSTTSPVLASLITSLQVTT